MKHAMHLIRPDRTMERAPVEDLGKGRDGSAGLHWLNVVGPDEAELARLLGPLALHPLAAELCTTENATSGVTTLPGCVVVRLPLRMTWDADEPSSLALLCVPGTMATVSESHLELLDSTSTALGTALAHHRLETASLVYLLVDAVADLAASHVLQARSAVADLQEELEEDRLEELGQTWLRLRHSVARLDVLLEQQYRVVTALLPVESAAFTAENLQPYFRDAAARLEHASRYLENVDRRLTSLHQQYQLALQERTGSRLMVLTILSAIFMPLTLIAGIYGMNFRHMPELEWPFAYPGVLALMVGITAALLWLFHRRGWFR